MAGWLPQNFRVIAMLSRLLQRLTVPWLKDSVTSIPRSQDLRPPRVSSRTCLLPSATKAL